MQGLGNSKSEVELFDGKRNFSLWQSTVKDILVQQRLIKALNGKEKKPEKMTYEEWEELEMKIVSTIWLCLAPEQQAETQIKRRIEIGNHISKRRLIDEITRMGMNESIVRRALVIRHQRDEVEYKRERRVIFRKS